MAAHASPRAKMSVKEKTGGLKQVATWLTTGSGKARWRGSHAGLDRGGERFGTWKNFTYHIKDDSLPSLSVGRRQRAARTAWGRLARREVKYRRLPVDVVRWTRQFEVASAKQLPRHCLN